MTEVASLMPPDHRLATVRHYEAAPPIGLELVEPGETFATTKEEEWVSKKKTEVTNTKQIETRVKRQVVLEDGKIVEDTGPMVTTNTTEDTETQEHHQTELRKLGDDDETDGPRALEGAGDAGNLVVADGSTNWLAVSNPDGVVREVKERKVVSREETEEVKETEDVQYLGDITDEDFLAAVRTGKQDLRQVLRTQESGRNVVSTGPRLVHESQKSNKVIDTEDTRELSSVRPDGKIVTETQRTTEHEEIKDEELPEGAGEQNYQKESSERYRKTREQEDVDYVADGLKVGHEMRFKTETMEVERRGDGVDEPDGFDSLSARARRRANRQPHRYRGIENGGGAVAESPLDRKDALTRRPLDFDQEEETRKVETTKWLEHHFGSESSNQSSMVDEEEHPPKTSFFNVTIKSQPSRSETPQKTFPPAVNSNGNPRVYSPVEPERDRNNTGGYYKGISEWTDRRQEQRYTHTAADRHSPPSYSKSPAYHPPDHSRRRPSPTPDYRPQHSPLPDYGRRRSPSPDYRPSQQQRSPLPPSAYRRQSPAPDYGRPPPARVSPPRRDVTPTPPARTRSERQRRVVEDRSRYENGFRSVRQEEGKDKMMERIEEPPPDYSPPSPPPMPVEKKQNQKTRFAIDSTPTKPQKTGNIIGQSIRKLVGKIRSASAERKARRANKRSPSPPTYQQGHVIDSNISGGSGGGMDSPTGRQQHGTPVQRYYLGEDPFAGSIYGRENKYDGVRPVRSSRRPKEVQEERRSQSTLGRFSKSTGRLVNASEEERTTQTLPRHLNRQSPPTKLGGRSNSTINVSIINTVSTPTKLQGPAKPARTYRSNLSRSKSLNVHAGLDPTRPSMHTSNPHLNKLEESPIGLKSPGLISSLNRSQRDVTSEEVYTTRFARNGTSDNVDNKRVFLSGLKDRAPELFKTLEESEREWKPSGYGSPIRNGKAQNGDIYEPPTRLRDSLAPSRSVIRRGSASSTDFSETYHTTTRGDDPMRPSVTNTTRSFTKKTIPSKDGRSVETIQSSETKSVTKSHYRGNEPAKSFFEERRYNTSSANPVVIEVRNYRK